MNSWSHSWSCVVGDGHFPSKTVVGHEIGHMAAMLGVGRVVCIKHRDFDETYRNANYLSAVSLHHPFTTCSYPNNHGHSTTRRVKTSQPSDIYWGEGPATHKMVLKVWTPS